MHVIFIYGSCICFSGIYILTETRVWGGKQFFFLPPSISVFISLTLSPSIYLVVVSLSCALGQQARLGLVELRSSMSLSLALSLSLFYGRWIPREYQPVELQTTF